MQISIDLRTQHPSSIKLSEAVATLQNEKTYLPAEDNQDFVNASRGLLKELSPCKIYSSVLGRENDLVWDNDSYKFLLNKCPETANPSLWRQSQLCYKQGLFEVQKGIYQVRGLDISNITFVETIDSNGVVVIDPLYSYECAKKALELYQDERGERKILAIIHTHSHVDHFGGVEAILEKAAEDVAVYAPAAFLEHAVSENVYAGNAMGRRAVYMFGVSLPRNEKGQIGTGLGLATSTGLVGMVAPTVDVSETGSLKKPTLIGDLEIVFQLTPGTEAPAELNFYLPQYKALCMAENATHTLHNIQTLRGALVRDARLWSRYLDESLVLFGKESNVVFSSHHWPTWGNEELVKFLSDQRDVYGYLHNETLRLLNAGQTGIEIAETFKFPDSLDKLWSARGYYGSISHNVKAIYHRYMGWFDGNPAHLWEHPPVEAAKRYVDCFGGIERTIDLGVKYAQEGDLRFASTLLSHAVFADQNDARAKKELASVFTILGYAAENATWRNFYLTGAKELLGVTASKPNQLSLKSLEALSVEQLIDTLAIRLEGPKAEGNRFEIEIHIVDLKMGWLLTLRNSVLTHREVEFRAVEGKTEASLAFWTGHRQLVGLVAGVQRDLKGLGTVGDVSVWEVLTGLLTQYDTGFAIVTPEK